jgi:hypothetical protein
MDTVRNAQDSPFLRRSKRPRTCACPWASVRKINFSVSSSRLHINLKVQILYVMRRRMQESVKHFACLKRTAPRRRSWIVAGVCELRARECIQARTSLKIFLAAPKRMESRTVAGNETRTS